MNANQVRWRRNAVENEIEHIGQRLTESRKRWDREKATHPERGIIYEEYQVHLLKMQDWLGKERDRLAGQLAELQDEGRP